MRLETVAAYQASRLSALRLGAELEQAVLKVASLTGMLVGIWNDLHDYETRQCLAPRHPGWPDTSAGMMQIALPERYWPAFVQWLTANTLRAVSLPDGRDETYLVVADPGDGLERQMANLNGGKRA